MWDRSDVKSSRLVPLPFVLLAVSLGGPAEPSPAASEPVTIAARPQDLARDRRLTLYGAIAGGAKEVVTLEARDCGQSSYRLVAHVATVFGGAWSWEFFYPGITASVRASWRGHRSEPVTVRDRAFVELRARGSGAYVVSVRAKLPFAGKRVELQRLSLDRGWTTLRTVVLTKSGAPAGSTYITSSARVEASVPARTLLRAVLPRSQARPCYLAGYSNLLRS
jgi:hypothetical protein